jgi:Ca-activated chloride channel family protein
MNASFDFENPGLLSALVAIIPLVLLDLFRRRAMKRRFSAIIGRVPGRWSGLFFWIFLALLIAALAGPRWGSRSTAEYRRGLDVVFAIDLSRSMEIQDVPALPGGTGKAAISRLDRGLGIALEALRAAPGARFAVAAGKGRGFLAVPLTDDTESVFAVLEGLEGFSLTGRGTNLEALVNAAASAFGTPFPSRRLIVLISDGEALSGSLKGALDRLREADIRLSALALGSDEGSPVPPEDDGGTPPVLSRRQAEALRSAADRTGGIYIDGNEAAAAALLGEHIRSLAPETRFQGREREPEPRRHLFILAAILAFGAAKLCRAGGRKKFLAAGFLIFFCSCSPVSGKLLIMEGNFFYSRAMYTAAASSYLRALSHEEAVPYAEYGLGTVYFSQDERKAALERYAASEKSLENAPPGEDRELRFRIPYNLGLVLCAHGEYEAAIQAFRAALEVDGSRIEAKRNLELSLRSRSRKQAETGQKREGGPPGAADRALFEYLRLKEQNQWKSREWVEAESPPGPDY